MEDAIAPSSSDAAGLLAAAPGSATWEWDLGTGAARFSEAVAGLVGVEVGELRTWDDLRARVVPDNLPHVEQAVRAALENGERWAVRYLLRPARGPAVQVLERGFVVRRGGRGVQALGVLLFESPTARATSGLRPPVPAAHAGSELRPRAELSQEQFHTFIDSLPQLAWTAGPDGWLDFYNRRWFEYTGTTFEQMEGWGWVQVHDPNDLPRMLRIWRNALVTGQPWEDEFRMRRGKDGMLRWHLSRALPFRDADGQIVRWFGTNTDIHDQKLAAEEYSRLLAREQRARKEAENANRAKDDFLALVSHELRTPLNAIVGWAHILRAPGIAEAKRLRGMEKIENNAWHQARLIEDLLDISRILTGKLAVDLEALEIGAALRAAVDTARPDAEARGLALTFSDESDGARVRGCPPRLRQIAGNLLSNAIKFTPEGGHVDVVVRRAEGDVEIVVRDDGEGITADFLPHLFERFRQASTSSTRRHGGLGLGLFLVRELSQAHGGEVAVHSEGAGRGATFTVRLPLLGEGELVLPAGPARADDAASAAVSLAGLRVLGVDDERSSREVLAEVLHSCGATVTLASSVHEALRAFRLDRPDVVVSDIAMPELDGYALIAKIRELGDPAARSTPAIALTAYASAQDRERALAAGFDRYLTKPVDAARLSRLVADLARERATSES